MTPDTRLIMPAAMIALALAMSCTSPEREAAKAAQNASEVAGSAEQKQLWQAAADKGDTPGLQRVPVLQDPVTRRTGRQAPRAQAAPAPAQAPPITVPAGVRNEIRILVYPTDPYQSYTGPARVEEIGQNGTRIRLALPGTRGMLTLLVRVGTKTLPLTVGDMVDVAYQLRRNPQVPNDVIAIRTAAGAGIAHVMQGGDAPVQQVVIPLFNLTAEQVNQPGFPVLISGPNLKAAPLAMGQQIDLPGGALVRIVGSTGPGNGTDVGLIEGAPFTLNVMVWRVP